MKKKLLSLILAGSVVASMAAIATTSASAIVDTDGTYKPGEGIKTKRVYFTLPDIWKNSFTNSAGCYWWGGTDPCTSIDGGKGELSWPGYKAKYDDRLEEKGVKTLYYLDIPDDVPTVVWNNYLDGGLDVTAPQYTAAMQCIDSKCEYVSEGDSDTYDAQEDFWTEMEDSFNGDKAALGDFADNFFISEYGIAFTLNNMIWVPDLSIEPSESVTGQLTYFGDWYFYYNDGTYGTYPTKEAAQAKGKFGDLSVAPAPPATKDEADTTNPTNPKDTDPQTTVPGEPSTDATSAVNKSTSDTTKSSDNTSIKTGAASLAVVLLVVLSGVATVAYFTRKKYDK